MESVNPDAYTLEHFLSEGTGTPKVDQERGAFGVQNTGDDFAMIQERFTKMVKNVPFFIIPEKIKVDCRLARTAFDAEYIKLNSAKGCTLGIFNGTFLGYVLPHVLHCWGTQMDPFYGSNRHGYRFRILWRIFELEFAYYTLRAWAKHWVKGAKHPIIIQNSSSS